MDFGVNSYQFCQFDDIRSEKNVRFKQICTHNYIVLHSISEFYYLVPEIK